VSHHGFSGRRVDPPHGRTPRFKIGQVVRYRGKGFYVHNRWWDALWEGFSYGLYPNADESGLYVVLRENELEPDGGEIIWDSERL
jgi:hypothetical protein